MASHRLIIGVILAGAVLGAVQGPAAHAQSTVIAYAAISGQVQPVSLASVGQPVKQGDILLFVRTTTGGAIPAARAPVDGRVVHVMVNPGDHVNIGDPVAVIEPK